MTLSSWGQKRHVAAVTGEKIECDLDRNSSSGPVVIYHPALSSSAHKLQPTCHDNGVHASVKIYDSTGTRALELGSGGVLPQQDINFDLVYNSAGH